MKGFGYAFAILGTICLIAIFMGKPQHIVTTIACLLMAKACFTCDDDDNDKKEE